MPWPEACATPSAGTAIPRPGPSHRCAGCLAATPHRRRRAVAHRAVGRDAHAVTGAAERRVTLAMTRSPRTVDVAVAGGRRRISRRLHWLDGPARMDAREHVGGGHNGAAVHAPSHRGHELDEAHRAAGAPPELGEGLDLVVVDAANGTMLTLSGPRPAASAASIASSTTGGSPATDEGEALGIERVAAHVHPHEPGVGQRPGEAAKRVPFVVMARSSKPSAARRPTMSTTLRRNNGSPRSGAGPRCRALGDARQPDDLVGGQLVGTRFESHSRAGMQ